MTFKQIFPCKSIRDQIWPCHKIGQGQPKVIICPLVLAKRIFEGFLPYMGLAAILVMWPRCLEQTFVPPTHGSSTWNLALIGPAVLEKKTSENGGWTDNGRRMMEHAYTISSPMSLKAHWWAKKESRKIAVILKFEQFYHKLTQNYEMTGKPCKPWSDCSSFRSILISVYTVCPDLSVQIL